MYFDLIIDFDDCVTKYENGKLFVSGLAGFVYLKYKNEADKLSNVYFGGRLGQYKYYDMDKVVLAALEFLKEVN